MGAIRDLAGDAAAEQVVARHTRHGCKQRTGLGKRYGEERLDELVAGRAVGFLLERVVRPGIHRGQQRARQSEQAEWIVVGECGGDLLEQVRLLPALWSARLRCSLLRPGRAGPPGALRHAGHDSSARPTTVME